MLSKENDAEQSDERRRTSMHREGEGRVVARRRERNDAVEQGTGDAREQERAQRPPPAQRKKYSDFEGRAQRLAGIRRPASSLVSGGSAP